MSPISQNDSLCKTKNIVFPWSAAATAATATSGTDVVTAADAVESRGSLRLARRFARAVNTTFLQLAMLPGEGGAPTSTVDPLGGGQGGYSDAERLQNGLTQV